MFSGLTSRCTSPARWAAVSALSTGSITDNGERGRHRPALAQQVTQRASLDELHDEEDVARVRRPWSKTETALT